MVTLDAVVSGFGEKTLIPIGLATLIVMLAVWLTRLDDKVQFQDATIIRMKDRIHELTVKCVLKKDSRLDYTF